MDNDIIADKIAAEYGINPDEIDSGTPLKKPLHEAIAKYLAAGEMQRSALLKARMDIGDDTPLKPESVAPTISRLLKECPEIRERAEELREQEKWQRARQAERASYRRAAWVRRMART